MPLSLSPPIAPHPFPSEGAISNSSIFAVCLRSPALPLILSSGLCSLLSHFPAPQPCSSPPLSRFPLHGLTFPSCLHLSFSPPALSPSSAAPVTPSPSASLPDLNSSCSPSASSKLPASAPAPLLFSFRTDCCPRLCALCWLPLHSSPSFSLLTHRSLLDPSPLHIPPHCPFSHSLPQTFLSYSHDSLRALRVQMQTHNPQGIIFSFI